ncbi:MAG: hypothetical protein J0L99_05965 [Chitinophagales bacterium]|nr:hypothetical protein [Chitinophagales bacterium]
MTKQSNIMAIYDRSTSTEKQRQVYLYGTARLGELLLNRDSASTWNRHHYRIKGNRHYELNNHLGNVLAVVTDRKMAQDTTINATYTPQYFLPDVYAVQNYYAFGQNMPKWSSSALNDPKRYRFGYNGKEDDDEWNKQDYGFRIYDTRLARFLSVDPLTRQYAWYSPYQFAGNMPIWATDLDGLEPKGATTRYVTVWNFGNPWPNEKAGNLTLMFSLDEPHNYLYVWASASGTYQYADLTKESNKWVPYFPTNKNSRPNGGNFLLQPDNDQPQWDMADFASYKGSQQVIEGFGVGCLCFGGAVFGAEAAMMGGAPLLETVSTSSRYVQLGSAGADAAYQISTEGFDNWNVTSTAANYFFTHSITSAGIGSAFDIRIGDIKNSISARSTSSLFRNTVLGEKTIGQFGYQTLTGSIGNELGSQTTNFLMKPFAKKAGFDGAFISLSTNFKANLYIGTLGNVAEESLNESND